MATSKFVERFSGVYGLRQLGLALIITTIITVVVFVLINTALAKPATAMAATIMWLGAAFIVLLRRAFKPEVSMVWQYSLSQVAVVGAVFGFFSSIWIEIGFLLAFAIFGIVAAIMFYFNLADQELRSLHKSYVPIHALAAALAFGLMYFKY